MSVPNVLEISPYLPDPKWFRHNPSGIHGTGHVTRVIVWSAVLAHGIGRPSAFRFDELMWAAACHDVGRFDDGRDIGHGGRSGAWVLESLREQRPTISPVIDIEFVAELCAWHEVEDKDIGRLSLELLILKDADGLDRARLGDLDATRLRFQQSRGLVQRAEQLFQNTCQTADPEEVLIAARNLLVAYNV